MRSHQWYKLDAERNTADTNRKSSILLKEKILTTRETTIYTTRPDGTTTDREPFFSFCCCYCCCYALHQKVGNCRRSISESACCVIVPRARYQKIPFLFFFRFSFSFWRSDIQPQPTAYIIHDGIVLHHAREREKEIGKKYTQEAQQRKSRKIKGEKIL